MARQARRLSDRIFLAVAPVQTDKTKESLAEMEKEFRGIVGDHPLDAADMKRIQTGETLRLPESRETLDALGSSLLELLQFGFPDDYYDSYSHRVGGLTTSDLANAARTVIHPDRILWIVVGDRSKIDARLKELKLGEIRYLAPDGTLTR
jgi:zinc protease